MWRGSVAPLLDAEAGRAMRRSGCDMAGRAEKQHGLRLPLEGVSGWM